MRFPLQISGPRPLTPSEVALVARMAEQMFEDRQDRVRAVGSLEDLGVRGDEETVVLSVDGAGEVRLWSEALSAARRADLLWCRRALCVRMADGWAVLSVSGDPP